MYRRGGVTHAHPSTSSLAKKHDANHDDGDDEDDDDHLAAMSLTASEPNECSKHQLMSHCTSSSSSQPRTWRFSARSSLQMVIAVSHYGTPPSWQLFTPRRS